MRRILCSILTIVVFVLFSSVAPASPKQEQTEYGNDRGETWNGSGSGDDDLPTVTAPISTVIEAARSAGQVVEHDKIERADFRSRLIANFRLSLGVMRSSLRMMK